MKKTVSTVIIILLILVFMFSGFMLCKELLERRISVSYLSGIHQSYEPELNLSETAEEISDAPDTEGTSPIDGTAVTKKEKNEKIEKLCSDYPDAIGWLTVEGAHVSLPFVIGETNNTYLKADLDGEYLVSGTLFVDHRNNRDLSDAFTVIYGHNMKNGTMFGEIENYAEAGYMEKYPDVYITLPEDTLHYKILALLVEDAATSFIFSDPSVHTAEDILNYVRENAEVYNSNIAVPESARVLMLSTCSYQFENARTVLICVA